jgi:23S rRNA pseudouridine955/2504/2580 synthase
MHKTFISPPACTSNAYGQPDAAAKTDAALTRVTPLASYGENGVQKTLVLAEIETGRTHQIRAQAAAHGHPLSGDKKYGGTFQAGGFLLHAWVLEIPGADDQMQTVCIKAPLPENFRRRIKALFGEDAVSV